MLEGYRTISLMDHHKKFSVFLTVDTVTGEIREGRVPGTRAEMQSWLRGLGKEALVYVEACRGWEWVSDLCEEQEIAFRLVNPSKMPEIWKSTKKTDKQDVHAMLSRLQGAGFLPESHRRSRPERSRRELTRARQSLKNLRRQTLNRLHALCDSHGLPSQQKDFRDATWQERMKSELGLGFGEVLSVWLDHLSHLDRSLKDLDEQIVERTREMEDVKRLQEIPGVGPVLAATIVSEVGIANRFRDARQFSSYCGLVPRVRASASTVKLGSITKAGPPALRWALTQAIVSGLTAKGNPFARYCRRVRRRGEGAMRAICAAAHKLARVVYVMLSRGVSYDPLKVGRF